jgi:purine-nucleoside phosphorylase
MNKDYARRVQAAVRSVRLGEGEKPGIGVILGSGLGPFADTFNGRQIPYRNIRGFPQPTVEGHRGLLKIGARVAVASGRFHYYEGWNMDDVVLPVFLLHGLGVRTLVITNAAGGVNRDYQAGDLVLIRDHINLMGAHPLRGPNPAGFGPRFPDMSRTYDPALREIARQAAGKPLPEGVYAAFSGPTYETPAEVRMAERMGADLVGMSTVPEAIAASYLGMRVLGISCVTNMAAGILDRPLSHEEVVETGKKAMPAFARLVEGVLSRLAS